ncbi:MAG: OmpH family outer membrane protein [Alphaproteobacteria bacterium]|nr:OmpH family outer membrane protein [Alphaproteobacteria bacterium]MBV9694495.1 OmpH family outer membrane protein [Alphaproteobacteria bacterium]
MMRKTILLAIVAAVFAASAAQAATPAPRILVIDRTMVLRLSKVGQDVVKQVNAYTQQAESQLRGEGQGLRQQGEALKQQLAILSADVKARKVKEFEARQKNLQEEAQKKQTLIQGGFIKARMTIENTLGPILQGIMVERNANLLLDKTSVLMGTDPSLDITQLAVQRLDQKLPSLHVDLVPPPPGMVPQQQQQQQQ